MKTQSPITVVELLNAETTLMRLSTEMAKDCKDNMSKWHRDLMVKNVNERAAIITVRQILNNRAESQSLVRPINSKGAK